LWSTNAVTPVESNPTIPKSEEKMNEAPSNELDATWRGESNSDDEQQMREECWAGSEKRWFEN